MNSTYNQTNIALNILKIKFSLIIAPFVDDAELQCNTRITKTSMIEIGIITES